MVWMNFRSLGQKLQTVAGLPIRTAVLYTLLFALAFWLYTSLWQDAPVMASDSGGYLKVSSVLADFHIDQLYNRTPGYPLILWITGSSQGPNRALFIVSLLMHFISIWVLASVLYSIGLRRIWLSFFGFILLLPPYVEPAAYVLSESLTEFTLAIGFGSLIFWYIHRKAAWLLMSALMIGYAGLTRPTYQMLAIVTAGSLFLTYMLLIWPHFKLKEMLKSSLILTCVSGIMIGGYAFLNYYRFDYFGLSPQMPIHLSTRTVRVLERLPDEYTTVREALIRARDADLVKRDSQHTGYGYIQNERVMSELTNITGLQMPQLSKYLMRINLVLIREAPLEYLYEIVRAFSSYWLPSSTMLANMNSRFAQLIWGIIHFCVIGTFVLTLVMLAGGIAYVLLCRQFILRGNGVLVQELDLSRLQGFVYIIAGTIVIYTAFTSSLFETGDPRYRVPTDGLIVLMSFLGTYLLQRLASLSKIVLCLPEKREP